MKLNRIRLNALSESILRDKEMNAIFGGGTCTCSCYFEDKGGSPDGTNMAANGAFGYESKDGCNQWTYDQDTGLGGVSGNTKA